MEIKEGEVLSREGKSIYTPEGAQTEAKRSAEQVFVRYRKMSWLTKIIAAPFLLFALVLLFSMLVVVGIFMLLSVLRGGKIQRFRK